MRIETVGVETLDGLHLEGDLALVADPRGAVVLAHPHPQYGGTRTNPVVDALFRSLPEAGFASLRFDFRGVGRSEGHHGGGTDERLDVAAAADLLATLVPDGPLWLAGYSFGALVALNVVDPRAAGWIAIAPPLAMAESAPLAAGDHRPTLLLAPEHDQFTSAARARELVWPTCELVEVAMADHFLAGRTDAVARLVVDWLAAR